MKTQFVLDAIEQAIWQRKTPDNKDLIHHSDRGSQYLTLKYTERLAEAEIDLSVGTVDDVMIMRWLSTSSACSKRTLSTKSGHGNPCAKSNGKH